MTAIIAWCTSDGKPGAASLYLAADSRITSKRGDGNTIVVSDSFQKIFPSHLTPDIFAVCGPVCDIRALIDTLILESARIRNEKSYLDGALSVFSQDLFQTVFSTPAMVHKHRGLRVFHGFRFRTREFGLSKVVIHDPLQFVEYALIASGGLLSRDGSGESMVKQMQGEYYEKESEAKEFSRWFWMSFFASLTPSTHETCGGAPQVVGLYSKANGIELGVYFNGSAFVHGQPCLRADIEYRDELFQRVDGYGKLLPNAQPHARKLGKPRIFNFAP